MTSSAFALSLLLAILALGGACHERPPIPVAGAATTQVDTAGTEPTASSDTGSFDGSPVRRDGGHDQASAVDSTAKLCPVCAADEICVQWHDGICDKALPRLMCRKVSRTCMAKVSPGARSCYAAADCESEFCPRPTQCISASPCGNELSEAFMQCYGP